jgi:hypothetical protein
MKRAHILPLLALAVPFLALAAAGPAHADTPPGGEPSDHRGLCRS